MDFESFLKQKIYAKEGNCSFEEIVVCPLQVCLYTTAISDKKSERNQRKQLHEDKAIMPSYWS